MAVFRSYPLVQLAALCRTHPVAPKVVFVPTRSAGLQAARALARSGIPAFHLHLTTPLAWARRTTGPRLDADRRRPLNRDVRIFFLDSLADAPPFPPSALARTLDALRLATTDPGPNAPTTPPPEGEVPGAQRRAEGVPPRATASPDPQGVPPRATAMPGLEDLPALASAYADLLHDRRFYDDADLLAFALDTIDQTPAPGIVAVFDETELSALEEAYVRRLAVRSGRPLQRIGCDAPGPAPPTRSAAACLADAPLVNTPDDETVGRGGFLWATDSDGRGVGQFDTVEVLGTAAEVDAVLRRLQADGAPWDHAEIAVTDARYLPLFHAACSRHDVPVTFAGGLPVDLTHPGRALRRFYAWIGDDLPVRGLVDLLAGRLLALHSDLAAPRAASWLRRAGVGRGRDRYAAALDRLETDLRERAASAEGDHAARLTDGLDELARLREGLARLLALVPPPGPLTVSAFVESSVAFLDRFAARRTTLDEAAVDTLVARFRAVAQVVDTPTPRNRLLRLFAGLLDRHRVGAAEAQAGALHVAPLAEAGYAFRPHLFVVGLDQSAFPGRAAEDPLLRDAERRRLSPALPLGQNAPADRNWRLAHLLGTASGAATLVASRYDLADDRPRYPSAAFLRALTLADSPPALLRLLPAVGGADPASTARLTLDDIETGLLYRLHTAWQRDHLDRHPWLRRGREAFAARNGSAWTPFDGLLGATDPALDPARHTLSAMRLETLLACPYRYFLRYVLRTEPPDALPDADDPAWLDPAGFGALLHGLFEAFLQEIARRGGSVSVERHAGLIDELLDRALDEHQQVRPPHDPAGFARDVHRLRTAAHIFLSAEADRPASARPDRFEIAFGMEDGLPAAELDLSPTLRIRLRGRIDRVDARDDGTLEIWDYKTGSPYAYDAPDLLRAGKLQWALYALALARLTGRPVARAGYFFPTDRAYGLRVAHPPPRPADLARLLEPLVDLAARGCFPRNASRETCRFCDYQSICNDPDSRREEVSAKCDADERHPEAARLRVWWTEVCS